jgi:hypothetical protein
MYSLHVPRLTNLIASSWNVPKILASRKRHFIIYLHRHSSARWLCLAGQKPVFVQTSLGSSASLSFNCSIFTLAFVRRCGQIFL